MNWEPVDHRPPLPRIETSPRYTPAPEMIPDHIRIQIEHIEKVTRQAEAERIWAFVTQSATGG